MSDESRRAAGILAQCKWLRDQIGVWERQAKGVIARELEGGERTKAVAADGTIIGAVTRAEGARSMQIDNEEGFLMWVKSRYPHEVVETVRPAFVKLCAEKVKVLGALPDANGELCPHVSLVRGEPTISARLGEQDKAVIEDMFMHRHVSEVMAEVAPPTPVGTIESGLIRSVPADEEWEVYTGHLDDTTQAAVAYAQSVADALPPVSNDTPDPEPFIEEGPPNWPDSNTFETSDPVRQRRQ
jgi:hypothetical protein